MIERNLGNAERIIRFFLGMAFGGWALSQPTMNPIEWFVVVVSLSLMFNGIFSRCYLWYLLDLDTTGNRCADSGSASTC